MPRTKQLTIGLENRPGRLAHVCRCLADRKINIMALSVADATEQSLLRLVVDKPDEATKMLKECPMIFTETQSATQLFIGPGLIAHEGGEPISL